MSEITFTTDQAVKIAELCGQVHANAVANMVKELQAVCNAILTNIENGKSQIITNVKSSLEKQHMTQDSSNELCNSDSKEGNK